MSLLYHNYMKARLDCFEVNWHKYSGRNGPQLQLSLICSINIFLSVEEYGSKGNDINFIAIKLFFRCI